MSKQFSFNYLYVQTEYFTSFKEILLTNIIIAEFDIVRGSNESFNECNEYLKYFSNESYLIIHYRINTGSKAFQCLTCQKTFS